MSIENNNVLITGGSSGIGLATAKAFIKQGANVIITGRNEKNLQNAATEINHSKLKTVVADTADLKSLAALEKIVVGYGKLDVLFLNAGISTAAPIEHTTEKIFDDLFNINVKGLYFTLQKLIPHLSEGASVIITSTTASVSAFANISAYAASKSAVDTIARVAAIELAERKIRVNTVSPGAVDTNILNKSMPDENAKALKEFFASRSPLRRIAAPEEIAATVLFLASDEAAYITVTYLPVDGGGLLRR